ncbi:MAG: hypothetical protein R3F50_07795 [Gammaproteobacteria bacterium]|jgi:uncharacterized membrane protein YphA (DoxX/SURF4 family)
MHTIPRFVSIVAILLGSFDIVRGLVHTVFVGNKGAILAGLDLAGSTGLDQLTLMIAFGASNLITGAALIVFGFVNRFGALIMLIVIPLAYAIAGVSLEYWGTNLTGTGSFPGRRNVAYYISICVFSVTVALLSMWRQRRQDTANLLNRGDGYNKN